MDDVQNEQPGIGRRQLIKRGAVVGGALVWATPVVQSLAGPAYAAGSAQCTARVIVKFPPPPLPGPYTCFDIGRTTTTPECCECLGNGVPAACEAECQNATGFEPSPPVLVTCP